MKEIGKKVYVVPEADELLIRIETTILSGDGNTPGGPIDGEPGEWDD